jgi:hypothetical protein
MPARTQINALASGAGQFVAVGKGGALLRSNDGALWTREPAGNASTLRDVAFGPAGFVAVGSAQGPQAPRAGRSVFVSPSGEAWVEAPLLETSLDKEPLTGIIFDGSRYVATAGPRGSSVQTSLDGTTWQTSAGTSGGTALAFSNGIYVSVGATHPAREAFLARSTDARAWTRLEIPATPPLSSVAVSNDRWVAVGDDGTILISDDSIAWRQVSSGTTLSLYAVAWGAGRFVAAGGNGIILSSSDGAVWTVSSPGDGLSLHDLAYGEGSYIAVGANGAILTAGEDMVWKRRNSGTSLDLFGVAYGNQSFVVVGDRGAILQSVSTRLPLRFSSLRASPAALQLRLIDEGGVALRLESSSNLIDWTELPLHTRQQTGLRLLDLPPPTGPQSFYRAVVP